MKTILIATSNFGHPVSNYYRSLSEELINRNYKVIFIFDGLIKKFPKENNNLKFYTWKNKRPTKVSDFIFLYRIIKKEKPIICISNFGSTNVVSIVSWLRRVKYRINYIHTTSKQIKLDSKKTKLLTFYLKNRKRIVYLLNNYLFTNSLGTKLDSVKHYKINESKISVFPLLINSSDIKYKTLKERQFSISIVGRLDPSKGHKKLLELFSELLKKKHKIILKIIGDGELKDDLISLCYSLNIKNSVIFLGNLPNKKVKEELSTSLINISASIDEAFGLVNIEALREGTPILCTKSSGAMDIVKPDINGLFFNLDSPASFQNAVEKILNNWDNFSLNSKSSFEKNYSYKNIINHVDKLENFINN